MLRLPIKRRLISLSPSSESLGPSSDSFVNPTIAVTLPCTATIFVRHLGIYNRICVKILKLMCVVITHNSMKKLSVYINKWLSYSQLLCVTAAILFPILEFANGYVSIFYNWCSVSLRTIQCKNEVSILINGWITAKYSVSRSSFCPPSWNL